MGFWEEGEVRGRGRGRGGLMEDGSKSEVFLGGFRNKSLGNV